MVHNIVYKNLRFVMFNNDMNMNDLSKATFIPYESLRRKLRDESKFLLEECIAIKAALKSGMPLEVLFEKEE